VFCLFLEDLNFSRFLMFLWLLSVGSYDVQHFRQPGFFFLKHYMNKYGMVYHVDPATDSNKSKIPYLRRTVNHFFILYSSVVSPGSAK